MEPIFFQTRLVLLFQEGSPDSMQTCVHAKSLQSCPTLCDPKDCSLPGSSVHSSLQARILEWVAVSSSRGSSRSKDLAHISYVYLHWQVGSLPPEHPFNQFRWSVKQDATCFSNALSVRFQHPVQELRWPTLSCRQEGEVLPLGCAGQAARPAAMASPHLPGGIGTALASPSSLWQGSN